MPYRHPTWMDIVVGIRDCKVGYMYIHIQKDVCTDGQSDDIVIV